MHCTSGRRRSGALAARIVSLLLPLLSTAASADIPLSERNALIDLFDSTGGANWTNSTNWNGAAGTECSWQGVYCNDSQTSVKTIFIFSNNLTGTLNASLADLTNMESLNLPLNKLTGSIAVLESLPNLRDFGMEQNELTGQIPPLAGLANLRTFSVSNNKLTGVIPPLAGLSQLTFFNVSDNALGGAIPSLTGLTALGNFWAAGNQLTGPLPALAGLTSLVIFEVRRNQLTGSIPALSGLAKLGYFLASDNQLTGSIPAFTGLGALDTFEASNNQLTGSLPALASAPGLTSIQVGNNQLSGPIPALSDAPGLAIFGARDNQLTGSIPALQNLSALKFFEVGNNQLTGNLPALAGLSALMEFSAGGNQLSGVVPAIAGLNELTMFSVEVNALTGPLPALANLPKLRYFNAGNNLLAGPIPELSGLPSLFALMLYYNRLTGTIPALDELPSLQTFYVQGNQLTGAIPPLAALTSLVLFDVHGNYLSGTMPPLDALSNLGLLDISHNLLGGPLPPLTGLGKLNALVIDHNRFTGEPPSVPAPGLLTAGFSRLCPNYLNHTQNAVWNAATGENPWFGNCSAEADAILTTLQIQDHLPSPSVIGVPVTVYVQLSVNSLGGGLAGGLIVIRHGAAVCMIVLPSNSCTLTPDAIGPGLLTAEYSGDTGFAASSASVMHRVVGIAEQSTFTLIRNGSGAGNVTSYDGMIDCGATCSHLYANGTELILYATPEPGSIFTGWLGACTGQVDCLAAVPSPVTVSATFALDASVPFNGDIDRDGSYSALTDGLIAMRYLFGLSGEAMVAGTLGADATRTDPAAVSAFLSDIRPRLDVDGNGSADALTDGVMLIRYLFGLRGAALINGAMGTGATRTTAAQIEAALQSLLP